MIFSNTSNYMLKYQKAKAKLVEYDIPQKDYPKFPLNSNELSYPVVYILSRYAESVIENNVADMEEFSPHLVAASQYFGLYIFDEGHMFDDGSRGAIYELLISEIRSHISLEEQLILLSAVLSNAEQIQKWLLGEAGVLASDPQIKATPKTIGFASQTKDIHYYSDDSAQEDFYVPRSIEVIALQKRPREKKQRYFPELTDAKDIAIYYANKLCKNGAAAIFANRTSTVLTVINRIIELRNRGHDLTEIKGNSDGEEMNQCCSLIYVTTALATASANLQGTALPICVYILPLLPQKM